MCPSSTANFPIIIITIIIQNNPSFHIPFLSGTFFFLPSHTRLLSEEPVQIPLNIHITPQLNRYQTCTKPDVDLPVSMETNLYLGKVRTLSKQNMCINFGNAHQEIQKYFSAILNTVSVTVENYYPYFWSWYTYATSPFR